ncbi:MAG: ComEC/Rec2 family competence protein [Spirochaetia bacterium]|jgi:ComEC/Rec2-related protein|nr:ComEC/Rec2 family competence protein [Spirochaetia bacterium]
MEFSWKAFFRDCAGRLEFGLSRAAPVVWIALSAGLSFYPLKGKGVSGIWEIQGRIWVVIFWALVVAGVSISALGWGIEGLGRGCVAHSGGGRVEKGCGPVSGARFWLAEAGAALALGLVLGASAALAETACLAPPELSRFSASSLAGRLEGDSRLSASGNTILQLRLDTIEVSTSTWNAKIEWPKSKARISLVVEGKRGVSKGMMFSATGVSPISLEQALFYAAAKNCKAGMYTSPAYYVRNLAVRFLAERLEKVTGKAFPLAQALLLGIRDDLDPEIPQLFRAAGCAHILALSGQHLSILCSLAGLFFVKVLRRRDLAAAAVPLIAILFTWIAGAGPSLLRAAIMSVAAAAASRLDRPQQGIGTLSLAFCLALAWSPSEARSLSFVLSYGAMVGLFFFSARWETFLWRIPPLAAKPLAASLAALSITSFISLPSFGYLALGGIIASALSGPLVLALMWLILGAVILGSLLPFLDSIFASLHEFLQYALLFIMEKGSRLPVIETDKGTDTFSVLLAIALLNLFVYAYPYAEYALSAARYARKGAKPRRREFHGDSL